MILATQYKLKFVATFQFLQCLDKFFFRHRFNRLDRYIYSRKVMHLVQNRRIWNKRNRTTAPPTEYRLKSFARAEKI